ncbi:caspase domain-containing protein [Mycena polygramma]|nr:caspase domain-containing protein [Mycena polygramma]
MQQHKSVHTRGPMGAVSSLAPTDTGRKKALLIGIRAPADVGYPEICEAHADVYQMRKLLLERFGYNSAAISVLVDDGIPGHADPTRVNILMAIAELGREAKDGDSLFFLYSGAGFQVEYSDYRYEMAEGTAIVPLDGEKMRILDKELSAALLTPLLSGARLVAILDTEHSGSLLDLEHYRCNHVFLPWRGTEAWSPRKRALRRDALDLRLPPKTDVMTNTRTALRRGGFGLTSDASIIRPVDEVLTVHRRSIYSQIYNRPLPRLAHNEVGACACESCKPADAITSVGCYSGWRHTASSRTLLQSSPDSTPSGTFLQSSLDSTPSGTFLQSSLDSTPSGTFLQSSSDSMRQGSQSSGDSGDGATWFLPEEGRFFLDPVTSNHPYPCLDPPSSSCTGWCRDMDLQTSIIQEMTDTINVVSLASCERRQGSRYGPSILLVDFLNENDHPSLRDVLLHVSHASYSAAGRYADDHRKTCKDKIEEWRRTRSADEVRDSIRELEAEMTEMNLLRDVNEHWSRAITSSPELSSARPLDMDREWIM